MHSMALTEQKPSTGRRSVNLNVAACPCDLLSENEVVDGGRVGCRPCHAGSTLRENVNEIYHPERAFCLRTDHGTFPNENRPLWYTVFCRHRDLGDDPGHDLWILSKLPVSPLWDGVVFHQGVLCLRHWYAPRVEGSLKIG